MPDTAFEVTYGCKNCGHEWSEKHASRVDVRDSTPTEDACVHNRDCDELGTHKCECCYHVACPVCELRDDVYVDDREPVTEDDS